jgi:hypothetical protein
MKPMPWLMQHVGPHHDHLLVQSPSRWRLYVARDLSLFVITLGAWIIWPHVFGTWLGVVCGIAVGLQLGRTALLGVRRQMTYRAGWVHGRGAMIASLTEALRRGMTMDEWVSREAVRDLAMIGEHVDPDVLLRESGRRADEDGPPWLDSDD